MADEGKLPLKDLQEQFKDIYDEEIEEEQLKTDLNDLVELTEEEVQSTVQLNEYETAPKYFQSSQNLTSDCLLISVYLLVFTSSCMMCS